MQHYTIIKKFNAFIRVICSSYLKCFKCCVISIFALISTKNVRFRLYCYVKTVLSARQHSFIYQRVSSTRDYEIQINIKSIFFLKLAVAKSRFKFTRQVWNWFNDGICMVKGCKGISSCTIPFFYNFPPSNF